MSPWGTVGAGVNVGYAGDIGNGDTGVADAYSNHGHAFRAVVNLSSYVEITGGDGSVDNPYIVK